MSFDITLKNSTMVITLLANGEYKTFKEVCSAIDEKEKSLVYPLSSEIILVIDEIEYIVLKGIEKIRAGVTFDDLVSNEGIRNKLEQRKKELESNIEHARETGHWDSISEAVFNEQVANVILTTSMFVANHEIEKELDIITTQCVYGMNIFRDIFKAVRDVVGGRAKAVEKVLNDARVEAMTDLRMEALKLGADAVIAVQINVSELNGTVISIVALGTAVKLKRFSDT